MTRGIDSIVALSLLALSYGFAISRILDPESIPAEQVKQALGTYFDHLTAAIAV